MTEATEDELASGEQLHRRTPPRMSPEPGREVGRKVGPGAADPMRSETAARVSARRMSPEPGREVGREVGPGAADPMRSETAARVSANIGWSGANDGKRATRRVALAWVSRPQAQTRIRGKYRVVFARSALAPEPYAGTTGAHATRA
jgi:hypothetical protein